MSDDRLSEEALTPEQVTALDENFHFMYMSSAHGTLMQKLVELTLTQWTNDLLRQKFADNYWVKHSTAEEADALFEEHRRAEEKFPPIGPEARFPPLVEGDFAGCDARVVPMLEALAADMLVLPNEFTTFPVAGRRIFSALAERRELFRRGAMLVELAGEELCVVKDQAFRSRLDKFGRRLVTVGVDSRGNPVMRLSRCSSETAKALIAEPSRELLPPVALVSRCAVLVESGGELLSLGNGYHTAAGGVLVLGARELPPVTLSEAREALLGLLEDFRFVADSDKSRAIATLLGPALRMGRLLPGHALVSAIEANESQTGKGYFLALVAATYDVEVYEVAQRAGGVGSLDESIASALLSGKPIVRLDNVRGALNSQYLESVLTATAPVAVRVPFKGEALIDARSVLFQLTSNGIEATRDLSNRMMITRLVHQPPGYVFRAYPEGGLLQHVKAQQPRFLAAVHCVVREWHSRGKPALNTDHSFREWTGALDWIVQELFGLPRLLDQHSEIAARASDPGTSWLRKIAPAAVGRFGPSGATAFGLADLTEEDEALAVPGVRPNADRAEVAKRIGVLLSRPFKASGRVELDDVLARRDESKDKDYRRQFRYHFWRKCEREPPVSEVPPGASRDPF